MMDRRRLADAERDFLATVGQRFDGDDLERTPERVADAWVDDLVSGYAIDAEAELTWTSAPPGTGPVLVREVTFASICVHHLLPFFGKASVAYLPHERLAGLSKIGRVVDALARRMQTQERLTAEIVRALDRALAPRGVLAVLDAEHTCMTLRGVRKEQSRMTTMASRGLYESDRGAREELLRLLLSGSGVDRG
jgi:GTP cyclohydrolase I